MGVHGNKPEKKINDDCLKQCYGSQDGKEERISETFYT